MSAEVFEAMGMLTGMGWHSDQVQGLSTNDDEDSNNDDIKRHKAVLVNMIT